MTIITQKYSKRNMKGLRKNRMKFQNNVSRKIRNIIEIWTNCMSFTESAKKSKRKKWNIYYQSQFPVKKYSCHLPNLIGSFALFGEQINPYSLSLEFP